MLESPRDHAGIIMAADRFDLVSELESPGCIPDYPGCNNEISGCIADIF